MKFSVSRGTKIIGAILTLVGAGISILTSINNDKRTEEMIDAKLDSRLNNDQPEEETEDSATTEDN